MKFRTRAWLCKTPAGNRRRSGFTLVEVLAALTFMAIVIPVAVQGLRIASLSGEVAQRKAMATRVGERQLNEIIATGQWQQAAQRGTVREGPYEFRWELRNETWSQDAMRQLSVEVIYAVQNQDYSVNLSTLVDSSQTADISDAATQTQ